MWMKYPAVRISSRCTTKAIISKIQCKTKLFISCCPNMPKIETNIDIQIKLLFQDKCDCSLKSEQSQEREGSFKNERTSDPRNQNMGIKPLMDRSSFLNRFIGKSASKPKGGKIVNGRVTQPHMVKRRFICMSPNWRSKT